MSHNFAIDLGVSNVSFQTFGCNKKSEKNWKNVSYQENQKLYYLEVYLS